MADEPDPLYQHFCDALRSGDDTAFSATWMDLRLQASRPWSAHAESEKPLDGHIPYDGVPHVWRRAPAVFRRRGIYVWGAWSGSASRVQYVGIADRQSVESRFRQRYANELRLAAKHGPTLRSMPDAFRARKGESIQRFLDLGIRGRRTRLPRAERYAKIGLTNLWHFVIRVPAVSASHGPQAPSLGDLETALIQHASAELFAGYCRGERGDPLVNILKVYPNRLVTGPEPRLGYERWLFEGPWWRK